MAEDSVRVVMLEQRSQHLGTHLTLPPQRHVGSHHLVVCVQVVTEEERTHTERTVRRRGQNLTEIHFCNTMKEFDLQRK